MLPLRQHSPPASEDSFCYGAAQTTRKKKHHKPRRISQVSLNLFFQGSHPSNEQTPDLVSFYELSEIAKQGTAQPKHRMSSPINPYPSFKY